MQYYEPDVRLEAKLVAPECGVGCEVDGVLGLAGVVLVDQQ